ncbi:MAG: hypothetical protein AABX11_01065 [Nanoarchaeota archaeon]
MLTVCIKSESPKIFGFVNSIIDTGSPTTILGWGDVQRMRISQLQMQKLIGAEREVNLGGANIKTRQLPEAELKIGEKIIKIPVQVPVKSLSGTPPPTILGIDFLIAGKFKFFFYPEKKESYLETED